MVNFWKKLYILLQDFLQKNSVKCSSVCYPISHKSSEGFCVNAMKYDVTYSVLFFGMKFNVTKNRQEHLIFECL